MDEIALNELLTQVKAGTIGIDNALEQLRDLPFGNLGYALVDHHRALRTGYPEVIFCQGKRLDQVVGIVKEQLAHNETVFGTRASGEVLDGVLAAYPTFEISRAGRCFWKRADSWRQRDKACGTILIATAGTADSAVAEEARCTVEILGHHCVVLQDVGVAGIHRLLGHRHLLDSATAIIVIAGMEGALPSVVAGLVSVPVVAVPTSVGYGAHLGGLVPLFAMLNSCASGLSVVNIDNGFGAAFAAATIADLLASKR